EGIGKYMLPKENTVAGHFDRVFERKNKLDFWAPDFPPFDGKLTEHFTESAMTYGNHPKYYDYEPLRDNIATVRNFVYSHLLPTVDTTEISNRYSAMIMFEEMATELGKALERDSVFRLPGKPSLDVTEMSEPGVGAAKMYSFLESKQHSRLPNAIGKLFGKKSYSHWQLPAVENSPFSAKHVQDFCLADIYNSKNCPAEPEATPAEPEITPEPQPQPEQTAPEPPAAQPEIAPPPMEPPTPLAAPGTGDKLAALGASIVGSAAALGRVDHLPGKVKQRAVEIARDILDKMRIQEADTSATQWVEKPAEEALTYNAALVDITQIYCDAFKTAVNIDARLQENPQLQAANLAMGKLAYLSTQQAMLALGAEGDMEQANALQQDLDHFPEAWKDVHFDDMETLLGNLQSGLEIAFVLIQQEQGLDLAQEEVLPGPSLHELLKRGITPEQMQTIREMGICTASVSPEEVKAKHAQAQAKKESKQVSQSTNANHRDAVHRPEHDAPPSHNR
ncbi:MAG: hypothetical protein ACPG80_01005, partial [Rickettsiales bacterium]